MDMKYLRDLRRISQEQGWSRHKLKSVRGQLLQLKSDDDAKEYILALRNRKRRRKI